MTNRTLDSNFCQIRFFDSELAVFACDILYKIFEPIEDSRKMRDYVYGVMFPALLNIVCMQVRGFKSISEAEDYFNTESMKQDGEKEKSITGKTAKPIRMTTRAKIKANPKQTTTEVPKNMEESFHSKLKFDSCPICGETTVRLLSIAGLPIFFNQFLPLRKHTISRLAARITTSL